MKLIAQYAVAVLGNMWAVCWLFDWLVGWLMWSVRTVPLCLVLLGRERVGFEFESWEHVLGVGKERGVNAYKTWGRRGVQWLWLDRASSVPAQYAIVRTSVPAH